MEKNNLRVGIIGAGFCGMMVAYHLLQQSKSKDGQRLEIYLFDGRHEPGKGAAYSTSAATHLLNVPAAVMGASAKRPEEFFDWLKTNNHAFAGSDFVPRRLYAQYLGALLQGALRDRDERIQYHFVNEEVVGIAARKTEDNSQGFVATCRSGLKIPIDIGVLAIGNSLPQTLPAFAAVKNDRNYFENPWNEAVYKGLSDCKTLLIVGTGLTAIDIVLEAEAQGFQGKYHLISRHGLLPRPHVEPNNTAPTKSIALAEVENLSPYLLCKALRTLAKSVPTWQLIVDALRPKLHTIWQQWEVAEKAQFLRHLKPLWEVHRHRAPPQSLNILKQLEQAGRLTQHAGRLLSAEQNSADIRVRFKQRGDGKVHEVLTARVINAIGPHADLTRSTAPLLQQLLNSKIIEVDPLHIGIEINPDFSVATSTTKNLFALGPLAKSLFWESTAVRELREQAEAVATSILRRATLRVVPN